jgi:predicted ester cyclase
MKKHSILFLMLVLVAAVSVAPGQKNRPQYPQPQAKAGQTPTVSSQQNKVVARRVFEELTNQGRYDAVDDVFDRNCKVHFGNRTMGLAQAVAEGKGWKSAAPDLLMNVEQVSESGDKVTVYWTARGTHTGPGLGAKPTRRQVSMRDKTVFLIKSGKIVEAWNSEYRQELFRQLGVSPTAASMIESTETLWAALSALFPDPLYASLH